MSSSLARIDVRLPAALKDQLTAIARERGVSLSEMAVSALQMMLEEPVPSMPQLGEVEERLARLEVLLTGLIKLYMSLTPEVPEEQKSAAKKRGLTRWDNFLAVLQGKREKA